MSAVHASSSVITQSRLRRQDRVVVDNSATSLAHWVRGGEVHTHYTYANGIDKMDTLPSFEAVVDVASIEHVFQKGILETAFGHDTCPHRRIAWGSVEEKDFRLRTLHHS